MEIKRFFANLSDVSADCVTLTDGEFYHATKVLRTKVGYKIIVCADGHTDRYATVTEIGKDFLRAKVDQIVTNTTETAKRVTLYQCIAKEMDVIVQKAVELGVKRLVPVKSRYVNAELNLDRLKKIVVESSKQCGRAALMELLPEMTLEEAALFAKQQEQLVVVPYERARDGRIANQVGDEQNIGIFVGSEGGFLAEEVVQLQAVGAKTVTLGKRILRAETAAIAAITLVLDSAGEMQ